MSIARGALVALALWPCLARADALDEALSHLPEEERACQACIVKGIALIRKDKRVARADRVKTSIFSPATFVNGIVTAKGGAVRSKDHWYALNFTCEVTKDLKRALSFDFSLGDEIPQEKWEDLGLW